MKSPTRVFLSYAHEDKDRANRLYANLEAAGFRPWMDHGPNSEGRIEYGSEWAESIQSAINNSDVFLALVSANSCRKMESDGVLRREVETALSLRSRKLNPLLVVPLRLDSAPAPPSLAGLQWVEFQDDDKWREVAAAIRKQRRTKALLIAAIALLLIGGGWWYLTQRSVWPGPQQLGVTMFKLEPATANDAARIQIDTAAVKGDFTPIKVALDHVFQAGDLVRVQVKAHQKAFLYVFDEEIGAGGDAVVLFPHKESPTNELVPNTLVDLPIGGSKCWMIQAPAGANAALYQGERLIVVLTPKKLDGITPGPEGVISAAKIKDWSERWGSQASAVQEPAIVGQAQSPSELQAGAKVLVDPASKPQTMFTLQAKSDTPIMLNVPMRVKLQ